MGGEVISMSENTSLCPARIAPKSYLSGHTGYKYVVI